MLHILSKYLTGKLCGIKCHVERVDYFCLAQNIWEKTFTLSVQRNKGTVYLVFNDE